MTSIATADRDTSYIGCDQRQLATSGRATSPRSWSTPGGERVERHRIEEYLIRKYAAVANLPPSSADGDAERWSLRGLDDGGLSTTTPGATIRYTLDGSEPSLTNGQDYADEFIIAQSVTVKAKAYLGELASTTGVFQFFASTDFNPAQVTGLQLWLRADAVDPVGGYVDVWRDQSGNGIEALQPQQSGVPGAGDGRPERDAGGAVRRQRRLPEAAADR